MSPLRASNHASIFGPSASGRGDPRHRSSTLIGISRATPIYRAKRLTCGPISQKAGKKVDRRTAFSSSQRTFSSVPTYETVVRPGETLPHEALLVACAGGTAITLALRRGLEIIKENPSQLRKSDLVLITDGESDTSQAQQLKQDAAALGTSILGIGIDVVATALLPWCDEVEAVAATDQLPDGVADKLFAG